MQHFIGEIIQKHRKELNLTQDDYGNRYDVSGPAIFKFEKGYVKPSLRLWMRISADANITKPWAVRIWLKESLPEKYREYVELQGALNQENRARKARSAPSRADFASCDNRDAIIELASSDPNFPPALRQVIEDDQLWALYRPTGQEINYLHDIFSPLGTGSKDLYREALCAIRLFTN